MIPLWILMQETPTPGVTLASTGPDPLMVAIIGTALAGVVSFGVSVVMRNWTHADREVDHVKQSATRDVDRVYGANTRELDQIQDRLIEIQRTQLDVQKAILRVELRLDVVEGFTETSKEITRSRGAVGSGR